MPDIHKTQNDTAGRTNTSYKTNLVPGEYTTAKTTDSGAVVSGSNMANSPNVVWGGASTGGSSSNSGSTSTTTTSYSGRVDSNTLANYNKYNQGYTQSQTVTDAYSKLQSVLNNKPGEFSSQYTAQLDNLYGQIINRPEFSYNQNDDVLYGLYKDQYTQAGKSAMQDTMGQMSAATGGYNSSAAQAAGYSAYANYLNELNNKALDLQSQAYNRYQDEGTMLQSKFNTTQNMYNKDYTQYRDTVSDWMSDRDYYQSLYNTERDFDYSKFTADRNYWNSEYWNQKKSATTTVTTSA